MFHRFKLHTSLAFRFFQLTTLFVVFYFAQLVFTHEFAKAEKSLQVKLGEFLLKPPQTEEQAKKLLKLLKSPDQDPFGTAHSLLGRLYEDGKWIPQNLDKAMTHYKTGVALNNPTAIYDFVRLNIASPHSPETLEQMYWLLIKAIKRSPSRAEFHPNQKIAEGQKNAIISLIGPLAVKLSSHYTGRNAKSADFHKSFDIHEAARWEAKSQRSMIAMAEIIRLKKTNAPRGGVREVENLYWNASICGNNVNYPKHYDPALCDYARKMYKRTRKYGLNTSGYGKQAIIVGAFVAVGIVAVLANRNHPKATSRYQRPKLDHCRGFNGMAWYGISSGALALGGCNPWSVD